MRKKISAEKAVSLMQFYLGSVDFSPVMAQQKFYDRVRKEVALLGTKTGMSELAVWEQVEAEARRRGIVRPMPGKHL